MILKKRIVNIISISVAVLVFILMVKYCYFDTKIGFDTEIVELIYSAFPMCVDVLISLLAFPFISYAIVQGFLECILNLISNQKIKNSKKVA